MKVEVYDVEVAYDKNPVLRGLSIGEVLGYHIRGIVGDNGSGKSTLLRALAGRLPRGSQWKGRILVDGRDISRFYTRKMARRLGVFLIPQDPSLVSSISVLDNIWLGSEETRLKIFTQRKVQQRTVKSILKSLNWSMALDVLPGELPLRDRQKIAVLRGLVRKPAPHLLLFDEPTTHLSPEERLGMLEELKKIAARGPGIILVSHRPSDLFACCDTISIIEEGRIRDSLRTKGRTPEELMEEVYGPQGVSGKTRARQVERKWEIDLDLTFRNVADDSRGNRSKLRLTSANKRGPFVAVTKESAQGEGLFDLLTGWGRRSGAEGTALLGTKSLFNLETKDIRRMGFGLVPSKKVRRGLCVDLTVHENLILTDQRLIVIWGRRARERAGVLAEQFGLGSRLRDRTASLSGGLQQKTLLAREFGNGCGGLFMREPIQGLDFDSREALVDELHERAGAAVLVMVLTTDPDDYRPQETDRAFSVE